MEFVEDMHAHLTALYASTLAKPELRDRYPKPSFKVVVLYVDEATSVNRQLARQAKSADHNRKVREARAGTIMCAPPLRRAARACRVAMRRAVNRRSHCCASSPLHFVGSGGTL